MRLLVAERHALFPLLWARPELDFDRPTVCAGWSVRDVLAHCGHAMTAIGGGERPAFTPEANDAVVAERRSWPLAEVLAELERGYELILPLLDRATGRLDKLVLGEWIHGGDVREAFGVDDAYASAGLQDALALFSSVTRDSSVPPTLVRLPDGNLRIGSEGEHAAELTIDSADLVRLCSGRPVDASRYTLRGATAGQYTVFS